MLRFFTRRRISFEALIATTGACVNHYLRPINLDRTNLGMRAPDAYKNKRGAS